jgi:hypothetical protein
MATNPRPTLQRSFRSMLLAPYRADFEAIRDTIVTAAAESRVPLSSVEEALQLDVTETVLSEILKADLIIAVVPPSGSGGVFYEIGLAHASGKPVIFLFDEETPAPFFVGRTGVSYNHSSTGLRRLNLALRKIFEDFRRNPLRFKPFQTVASRPTGLPFVDLERLEPREFENLCFELLNHMGYRRVEWGKQLEDIDVVATLPKKDPDGFEYQELWLISTGLRTPPEHLIEMLREPDYLTHRLKRAGLFDRIRNRSTVDAPITMLLIFVRDSPSTEFIQQELRRIDQRSSESRSHTIRLRVWDRPQMVALIQQYPPIALKYFSDDGRAQSEFRKSYEQLYVENASLLEKNQATINAFREEKDKRIRAERDAVWKDVAFTAAHKLGNPIFALETNLQGLKRNIPTDPKEALDVAGDMGLSIEKAKAIIDQFKSLTKSRMKSAFHF